MALTNLLTCAGFEGVQKSGALSAVAGDCIKARLAIVFMFFFVALVRKWGGEELGMDFSFLFGLIGGIAAYVLLITLTGSLKFSFGIGLLIALVGGYGGGAVFGGGDY